jgi:hypothetical protein
MSHRLLVNGNRYYSYTGTLWHQATQPKIIFPVTASVTTLFHLRHAKYRKYTESRRLSATAHPPYVPSTTVNGNLMLLIHRHPLAPNNLTGNSIPVTASVTTLFHNRHAKYRKYTESRRLSTTAHPPYVPSTSGQRQSMLLIHRHPLAANNPTGNSIPRHRKRHNTFP